MKKIIILLIALFAISYSYSQTNLSGLYYLQEVKSQLVVGASGTNSGSVVTLQMFNGSNNQIWEMIKYPKGYVLKTAASPNDGWQTLGMENP